MADYAAIAERSAQDGLAVFGAFHPAADDGAPDGCATMMLLGPAEPGFWDHVTRQREFADGAADPLDRWSRRVIDAIAEEAGGGALFPFSGPPWQPFLHWALRSGRAWQSPVGMLVHDTAGLMVSYRGAIALPHRIVVPTPPQESPCAQCPAAPCRTACPAAALTPAGYDTEACHRFLDTGSGNMCLSAGCAVRRACPVSAHHGRQTAQSAYHMRHFHPA